MDQHSSSGSSFYLHSQAGVMSLLASIRGSQLSATAKNELRDLVFLYTNGGGDNSVRLALEQKLATHQITPIAPVAKPAPEPVAAPAPVLSFGSSRPAPVFKQKPVATPAPAVPKAPEPVAAVPTPAPIPVSPTEVKVPVQSAPATPTPRPVPPPQPIAEAPKTAPAMPAAPAPAAAAPVENVEYLNRIREIKSAVNSKVGNPVNLVDINIEVAVAEHDKNGGTMPVSSASVSQPVATPTPAPVPTPEPEKIISGFDAMPTPEPIPALPPVTPVTPPPAPKPEPVVPPAPKPQPIAAPVPEKIISGFDAMPTPVPEPKAPTPVPPAPAPAIHSVATDAKIMTPADLPAAESVATSITGDPLMTREIDDGLEQLLSDWSLFKKSGLFGTGPHGREHPLFKKIAGLPIPLLLAGRFEGSTQEIKQSITDYMNG